MAQTNTLAGYTFDRKGRVYFNSGALDASVTTVIHPRTAIPTGDSKTTRETLGRNATGKVIPRFFCKSASGSSASFAVKVQHAHATAGVAEASWDWEDLVSFTNITSDGGTSEVVDTTKSVRPFLRVVVTRTGGTVTGLEVGYEYAQVGPRTSMGSSVFTGSLG